MADNRAAEACREPGGILIINLGGIGDLILSTPALKALRRRYAGARISLTVVPDVYEAAREMSYVDETFVFDARAAFSNARKNLETLLKMRKRKFDLAVNMRTLVSAFSAFKMRYLLDMINPRLKAGRDTAGRGAFFDIRIEETVFGDKHEMDYDIDMAEALDASVIDRSIDFKIDARSMEKARKMLKDNGVADGDLLIGVHTGGKPSHRWPLENFFAFMKKMSEKTRCKFVVTGDGQDAARIDEMRKESDMKIVNAAARLNIRELGGLIKMCGLYISNDTGPMHIAAAFKTPLVAIFGPGYLRRYDPRAISDKAVVLYHKACCAPCDRIRCDKMECLKKILPEEVMEASLRFLG